MRHPSTERLELTVQGEQPQLLELDSSRSAQTTVDPGDQATVTAYDSAGDEIGSTPLLPFREAGPLGEAKGTRLVP
ncbi:hypothetical protein LWF15_21550 [Kineosporia rhizophila]|uniref:hypothetical protein n=1 Tax=Kineosporia TaxID=49184 RepID=UPI001E31235A|nr:MULTISPECIES: hypothetical protein [Kineosporia]MCE0538084.1 hypothetical protein [Kineosporia rhizophila]GLY14912.1 hypothetical protein Kisp01_19270 [Kineosporia sp. NBRC 101677]